MSGRLGAVTHGKPPEDYEKQLKRLQERLYELQIAYRRQKRSAVVVLEGWDAAGKGGLIKRMTAELDPRFFEVIPISAPDPREKREHYLTRFWRGFPEDGDWSIFDRSWYGRVLVERIEGFATKAEWSRAYDEINQLETMLLADGVRMIKIFLHISEEKQHERLVDRLQEPWKRWKVTDEDFRNIARRTEYLEAYEEMFERTDKKEAPWCIIGGDHKKYARIHGLSMIADHLARGVDVTPPQIDPALHKLAEKTLGRTVKPR
ncbi:MAG: polyphosphate kinase [Sphingomonadaceae bacterium]